LPERESHPAGNVGRLVGPYELVQQIGSGGMGEVYLGHDRRLDRSIAVKAIRPDLVSDPGVRARFLRETRAASAIVHPFVATVFDVIEQEGETFLVMEYIQGKPLDTALREGIDALPLERRLGMAGEIAEALAAIHGCGLTHRDLKPSNVLVTPNGHVKVIDLGLARRVPLVKDGGVDSEDTTASNSMTSPGTVVGTLAWMAPEQVRGEEADFRSDLFSLGVILHQLLTGEHPFLRATAADTISAILTEAPRVASGTHSAASSPAAAAIRDKCLAKKREDRYGSAEEVAKALRAAAQDESVRAMSRSRRLKTAIALGATLLVGVGATAGVLTVLSTPPTIEGPRVSLAIVPLGTPDDLPDGAAHGREVADLLAANLSGSKVVRVVGPEQTEPLATGLGGGRAPEELVARIGAGLSVEYIVTGTLQADPQGYRADVSLHCARGGGASKVISAGARDTSILAEKLGARIRGALPDLPVLTRFRDLHGDLSQWTSPSESARLHYEKGMLAFRAGKPAEALAELEAAVRDDAGFIRAHASLASVLAEAGYGLRAREAATKARALIAGKVGEDGPSRRLALTIDAVHAQVFSEPQRLIDTTAQLVTLYPDEPELLEAHAKALLDVGRNAPALVAVDRALKIDPARPSLHLLRGTVLGDAGRYADGAASLDDAERLYRLANSAEGLAAVARERGHRLYIQASYEAASRECARAIAAYDQAGRDVLAADVRRLASNVSLAMHDPGTAAVLLAQAETIAERAVNPALLCKVKASRGAQKAIANEMAAAEELLREAVDCSRSLQLPPLLFDPLSNYGSVLLYEGKREEAKPVIAEVRALARQLMRVRYEVNANFYLADIDFNAGNVESAVTQYEQALAQAPDDDSRAWAHLAIAEIRERQGKLAAALEAVDAAAAGYRKLGSGNLGYALARRATVMKALGRNADAERDLEEAIAIATTPKHELPDVEARCALAQAEAYAIDGRWRESLAQAEKTLRLAGGAAPLTVPARAAGCRALMRMDRAQGAIAQCRAGSDDPAAPAVERALIRSFLVEALVRAGRLPEARREAESAMTSAETMDVPLAAARIAAAMQSLPARDAPPETSAYRTRGLAALEAYISGAPEAARGPVRERSDVKVLWQRLNPRA
jgi:tetratricopeptide (TPR) repeat protein/tRNA A-37 threonylcarbamoyl transferase component Bud32